LIAAGGGVSLGVKRPGREADRLPQSSAEVTITWIYTSILSQMHPVHIFPPCFLMNHSNTYYVSIYDKVFRVVSSLQFPNKTTVYILSSAMRASWPSNPIPFIVIFIYVYPSLLFASGQTLWFSSYRRICRNRDTSLV